MYHHSQYRVNHHQKHDDLNLKYKDFFEPGLMYQNNGLEQGFACRNQCKEKEKFLSDSTESNDLKIL